MIIEFSIQNFRSIKKKLVFSLEAEAGQTKQDNLFEVTLINDSVKRLVRSAVIYGPNASGKSNVIRALYMLFNYIRTSGSLSVDEPIRFYDPFLFDEESAKSPTVFELDFIVKEDDNYVKYKYHLEFNRTEVVLEELYYYPKSHPQNLFTRKKENIESEIIHTGKLGKNLGYKEYKVFRNQLFISLFGKDIAHEQLSNVYLFLSKIQVWNVLDQGRLSVLRNIIAGEAVQPENKKFLDRINKLIQIADVKIQGINIIPQEESENKTTYGLERKNEIFALHDVYQGDKKVGSKTLPFREESAGTKVLFALGGIILEKLDEGGTLFFDEIDNSLHPKLSKFLVRLFNNPISNPKNAQLIVATHEVTLLDKDVFRKDQIWFAEKNERGATEVFSVKDFEGVRDDTPFDKWYMNGKFGGQPKIKEIEFIFSNG